MRKNNTYEILTVSTRNDFIDAISNPKSVIEIVGGYKADIIAETQKLKEKESKKFFQEGNSIGFTILGLVINPIFGAVLGGVALINVLRHEFGIGSKLKHHSFWVSLDGHGIGTYSRFFYITKDFNPKYDTINGLSNYTFYADNTCGNVNCGNKIEKIGKRVKKGLDVASICPGCHRTIIYKMIW